MSESTTVTMAIGDVQVHLHGDGRATVSSAGEGERNQVGKFSYRFNIYFARDANGEWEINSNRTSSDIYHTHGSRYFNPPARTIRAKIEETAKSALLRVIKDNRMALADADVAAARTRWERAERDLEQAKRLVESAQLVSDREARRLYTAMAVRDDAEQALAVV